MNKTFFDYLLVLTGTVASRGLAFLNSLLIARMLGPEPFGMFSIFYAAMVLTWQIPLAFDAVFVAYAKRFDTPLRKNELLKAPILIKILYAGIVAILCYPLALFLAKFCFQKNDVMVSLLAAMFCGVFINFLGTIASIYQEKERFASYSLIHSFFTVIVFICLLIMIAVPDILSLYAILVAYILVSILVGSASIVVLIIKVGNPLKVEKGVLKHSFSWGKWIIGSQIAFNLFYRLDIFFLTRYVDFEKLGVYSVAAQLNYIIGLATGSLAGICLPKAGEAIGSRKALKLYFRQSIGVILLIEIGIVFFMIFAPLAVAKLYGDVFAPASRLLQVLALGWVFHSAFVPFSFLFIAMGDAQTKFFLELLKLGVGFGLMLWLVPCYGLIGTAWAMSSTLFFEMVISFYVLKHRLSTTSKQMCFNS